MKKIIIAFSALALLTGCYDSYVMDYDGGAGIYTAYQYDLRTFVMGENESFDFTVALGGVMENTRDRSVKVELDNSLLTKDLSTLAAEGKYEPFTAIDAFLGNGKFGNVCQPYVTAEVFNAKLKAFEELPEAYYTLSGLDGLTIKAGRHTAKVTVKATDFIKGDAKAFAPCYALGFQILSADCEEVVPEWSFEVIAVKCENRFYGHWCHGGKTQIYNASGVLVDESYYEMSNVDDRVYTLTTVNAQSVVTNKMGQKAGKLLITVGDDNSVTVASADGKVDVKPIDGMPSTFNGEQLIQNRRFELNYQYTDGAYTYVINDVLEFRDRTRDGVLEYQDERTELYK